MTYRTVLLVLALSAVACVTAGFHYQHISDRHTPLATPCEHPPIYSDRGPERVREPLAIVTAECASGKPEECRTQLEHAGCAVGADAMLEVSDHVHGRTRRMVGTAVEYTDQPAGDGGTVPDAATPGAGH